MEIDILKDEWILSEPVTDDSMKTFIGVLLEKVGI
jgi:hypothetical protein